MRVALIATAPTTARRDPDRRAAACRASPISTISTRCALEPDVAVDMVPPGTAAARCRSHPAAGIESHHRRSRLPARAGLAHRHRRSCRAAAAACSACAAATRCSAAASPIRRASKGRPARSMASALPRRRDRARLATRPWWRFTAEDVAGVPVRGYEMHVGITRGPATERPLLRLTNGVGSRPEGAVCPMAASPAAICTAYSPSDRLPPRLPCRPEAARCAAESCMSTKSDPTLDALADHLTRHLDLDRILEIARQ